MWIFNIAYVVVIDRMENLCAKLIDAKCSNWKSQIYIHTHVIWQERDERQPRSKLYVHRTIVKLVDMAWDVCVCLCVSVRFVRPCEWNKIELKFITKDEYELKSTCFIAIAHCVVEDASGHIPHYIGIHHFLKYGTRYPSSK